MTTASEPTNYIYSALSAANIDPELAHNASEQVLNVAGRNITDHVDSRFDAVDSRFDHVDSRFNAVDKRIDTLDKNLSERIATLDRHFNRIVSIQLALIIGIVSLLAAALFK